MAPIDRTAPRNAMRSGGVTVPYASTLVARRPLTPPEFTTETVASMPAERSPMPLTDPFGPKPDHFVAAFVEMEWKNIVNFPPATSTPWIVETSWPSRGRKTMTLVAWKGGGGNMVGIASPTGTCATTRAPTGIPVTGRIPVAGRGPAIGPSPLVMVAFATSIRNWHRRRGAQRDAIRRGSWLHGPCAEKRAEKKENHDESGGGLERRKRTSR